MPTSNSLMNSLRHPATNFLKFLFRKNTNMPFFARIAIRLGANPLEIDPETGDTYAHQARSGEMIAVFYDWGVNLETRNRAGETPLLSAAKRNVVSAVEALIDFGANVNAHNSLTGETALHLTTDESIMRLLTSKNADINAQAENRDTPIHRAIRSSQFEKVRYLSENHARIDIPNNAGRTAITELADKIDAIPDGERNRDGWIFKHMADSLFARFLHNINPGDLTPIGGKDNFTIPGFSLLDYAAQKCTAAVINMLSTTENVDKQNSLGRTALMYAARFGNDEAVERLRKKGASVQATDTLGNNAQAFANNSPANCDKIKELLKPTVAERVLTEKGNKEMLRQLDKHPQRTYAAAALAGTATVAIAATAARLARPRSRH